MDDQRPVCDLSELVEKYYALLYRYAFRLSGSAVEAEDLTQQTFLTAQTKIDQLRDPHCVKSWLFTIVRNTFLKTFRSSGTVSTLSLESVVEPADEIFVEESRIHQELHSNSRWLALPWQHESYFPRSCPRIQIFGSDRQLLQ